MTSSRTTSPPFSPDSRTASQILRRAFGANRSKAASSKSVFSWFRPKRSAQSARTSKARPASGTARRRAPRQHAAPANLSGPSSLLRRLYDPHTPRGELPDASLTAKARAEVPSDRDPHFLQVLGMRTGSSVRQPLNKTSSASPKPVINPHRGSPHMVPAPHRHASGGS